jgi:glutathione S-transferase
VFIDVVYGDEQDHRAAGSSVVHLDLRRGDAQRPEHLKLIPNAVVPMLVHDGRVVTESTVICEYIDDQWPDQPLKPRGQLWSHADGSLDEATRRRPAPGSGHSFLLRRLSPSVQHRMAAAEWLIKQDPMLVGSDNQSIEVAPTE